MTHQLTTLVSPKLDELMTKETPSTMVPTDNMPTVPPGLALVSIMMLVVVVVLTVKNELLNREK